MPKSAVYSWRLPLDLKSALEDAARRNRESTAHLLERITRSWLEASASSEDEEQQRRLHAAAAQHFGALSGGRPQRSSQARETLQSSLAQRRRIRA